MKYTLIDENGQYALILRGEHMTPVSYTHLDAADER